MMSTDSHATAVVGRAPPRAQHVGSLLRPPRLLAEHQAELRRQTHATAVSSTVRELEDECIREIVAKQMAVGLDVVTDGEFRRSTFMGSFDESIAGFAIDPDAPPMNFRNDTESYSIEGSVYAQRRLQKIGNVAAAEAAFLNRVAPNASRKATFLAASTAANPGAFKPGVTDQYYSDPIEMSLHVMSLERELIDETISAGANVIQLDFPGYPLLVDEQCRDAFTQRGLTLEALLDGMLMADGQIVAGLPSHVHKSLHICRGNGPGGTWLASGSLEPLAEQVFSLPYDSFLVEWDDPSRQGDFSALRHVPDGPVIVMGLISTKSSRLEADDDIMRKLDEAAQYIDIDHLALSPQCGFASVASGNPLTVDDQWRKLELIARIADRIWPR